MNSPGIRVRDLVREWYAALPKPVRARPTLDIPDQEIQQLVSLLNEEESEFRAAILERDIEGVADALADIVYVAYGASLQFGFDLDRVIAEVHRANMSKRSDSGAFEFDTLGKVRRGDRYVPPDLGWLRGAGAEQDEATDLG